MNVTSKKAWIIFPFLLLGFSVHAQYLIEAKPGTNQRSQDPAIQKHLEHRPEIINYQLIHIDLDRIKDQISRVRFFELDETIHQSITDIRGVRNFTWTGANEEKDLRIILSVRGNDVQGFVIKEHLVEFMIETVDSMYLISEIDQSKYKPEACHRMETLEVPSEEETPEQQKDVPRINQAPVTDPEVDIPQLSMASPFDCHIRVLVMYTQAAKNQVSNIVNTAQLGVDLMNQAFDVSLVNSSSELVYAGQTSYTEANDIVTDLYRFRNNNDNFMDEVHTLRNEYAADVCILFTVDPDYCGIAFLNADPSLAFGVVDVRCVGNATFAHEVGHMFGCRHDTYVDPSTQPYPYGHGYVHLSSNPNQRFATIMAYNSQCANAGYNCPRLLAWSNPNLTYNGIPIGNATYADNARLNNERHNNMLALIQPQTNVTVNSSDVSNLNQGHFVAKNQISTSGSVSLLNGKEATLSAGSVIVLSPGFTAGQGSDVFVQLGAVGDCGSLQLDARSDQAFSDEPVPGLLNWSVVQPPYPNPTSGPLTIEMEVSEEMDISISVMDFLGKITGNIFDGTMVKGIHKIEDNLETLIPGVYFVVMAEKNSDYKKSMKIIKQ